jgi:hypothetical protein
MKYAFILAAIISMGVMENAYAQANNENGNGCRNRCGDTINNNVGGGDTTNRNRNTNINTAGAVAGAAASANSRSTSTSKAVSGGNSMSVNVGGDDVEAPAIAPNITLTSHGCIGSSSGSTGLRAVVSLGFGTTEEMKRCTLMEAAKIYLSMGRSDIAMTLLGSIDWVKEAREDTGGQQSARRYDFPRYDD